MRTPCTQCGHPTRWGTADIFAEDNRHVVCPRLPDPLEARLLLQSGPTIATESMLFMAAYDGAMHGWVTLQPKAAAA
jgi:hypothetical protein